MKTIYKKKGFWIILALIALFACLAFGGDEPADVDVIEEEEESEPFAVMPANPVKMTGETISVYNWGDYIDSDVIDIFEIVKMVRIDVKNNFNLRSET